MAGIGSVGRSNRAGTATEAVEGESHSVDPEVARRTAEAAAEQRRNDYSRDVSDSRGGSASSGATRSKLDQADIRSLGGACASAATKTVGRNASPAEGLQVAGLASRESISPNMDALANDVMRLRTEKSTTTDPARLRALSVEANTASSLWCELARARGMKPPSESFDPFHASDAELVSAFQWTEIGNAYPVNALSDGGAHFQKEIHLALIVRSPAMLSEFIAKGEADNPDLLAAMYKELRRIGDDRPCTSKDTVVSLMARRAEVLEQRASGGLADAFEGARRQLTIGLDGRVGTAESIGNYEIEQGILAANPGSLLGTIGAGISASHGGSIEDRRRVGQAGKSADGLLGILKASSSNSGASAVVEPKDAGSSTWSGESVSAMGQSTAISGGEAVSSQLLAPSLRSMSVKPEPSERDDASEAFGTDETARAPEFPQRGGYRVAGDIEVRSKELEQELVELRARYSELEREVWKARKVSRTNRALAMATMALRRLASEPRSPVSSR